MTQQEDAFSRMMRPNPQKKRRTSNISFVPCPVCSKHVNQSDINNHLDKCMSQRKRPKEDVSNVKVAPKSLSQQHPEGSNLSSQTPKLIPSHSKTRASQLSQDQIDQSVFGRMMKSSKAVFTQASPIEQCFWLDGNNFRVELHTGSQMPPHASTVHWSETIRLRDRIIKTTSDVTASNVPPVDAHVCTSLPVSLQPPPRWVKHHSRLSVPVLKSILQKNIRRRRPLPAVRVAMELADKGLGELLRRLPIIILEDSTMHPDFPILVWLMMAHSKDYIIGAALLQRVFCVVFQVASCQWKDTLPEQKIAEGQSSTHEPLILSRVKDDAWIWSMLARASYGGMQGDVEMLQQFASLWKQRTQCNVGDVSHHVMESLEHVCSDDITWRKLPGAIHSRLEKQCVERVSALCATGIDNLAINDICLEGVDFHCSNVLDTILGDPETCDLCWDFLVLSEDEQLPTSKDGKKDFLEQIFRSCMWKYASGVNYRQNLTRSAANAVSVKKSTYDTLWKELLEPASRKYQRQYIQQRLYY